LHIAVVRRESKDTKNDASFIFTTTLIDITLDIPINRYLSLISSKIRKIRARSVISNGIFYNILMSNHGCKLAKTISALMARVLRVPQSYYYLIDYL